MVVKSDKDTATTKYNFNRKGGRSIVERRPIFSPDGEYVLAIVENVVRVYNIETAECARVLETESNVKELVGIQFIESDKYNLYGCSDTGVVIVWTWDNGSRGVLREKKLQLPPNAKVLSFDMIDKNDCFITASTGHKHLHLASYSIQTGDTVYPYRASFIEDHPLVCVSLGVCDGDRYAAISNGTKCLFIQNLVQPHLKATIINQNNLRVIAVSAHPVDSCVAITDSLGRVTIYRGYLYNHQGLAKEVMHWHFLPAFAVCFPREGSYLLSGGMEKVLVKWSVGHVASRAAEKQFMPRLPGLVRHIAASDAHVAVALSDNSIVIASARLTLTATIRAAGGRGARGPAPAPHRPLRALLLAARGHAQLWRPEGEVAKLDVTGMNDIPPTRSKLLPVDTAVESTGVSADGSWLVTSEYRSDGTLYPEERLKFWAFDDTLPSKFRLNTCVNLSHGGCKVVSIAVNNTGDFCVTAGTDEKFRIWKRYTTVEDSVKKVSWGCLTACYYSSGVAHTMSHSILNAMKTSSYVKYDKDNPPPYLTEVAKDDVITNVWNINKYDPKLEDKMEMSSSVGCVAISPDGSLVAACAGARVALWDTHLCAPRTALAHPALRPAPTHVAFGDGDAAHYLVTASAGCVAVWSLLSLSLRWLVPLRPACLVAEPAANRMAVVTEDNDVFVFTPHSPAPLLSRERLLNPRAGVLRRAAFAAPHGDDFRLYLMRNDSEIYSLEPESAAGAALEGAARAAPPTAFGALVAEQRRSGVSGAAPAPLAHLDSDGLGKTAIAQFLSAAPHMMPPVGLLATAFLEHISGHRDTDVDDDDPTAEADERESSSEVDDSIDKDTDTRTELWTQNYEAVREKRMKKILSQQSLGKDVALSLFEM